MDKLINEHKSLFGETWTNKQLTKYIYMYPKLFNCGMYPELDELAKRARLEITNYKKIKGIK